MDSSSTSASCVGSNPTGVIVIHGPRSNGSAICCRSCDTARPSNTNPQIVHNQAHWREQLMHLASGLELPSCVSGRVAAVAVVYACAGALLQRLAVWPSQTRIPSARFQEAQCERESLRSGGFGECVRFSAFALGGLHVTRWIARMDRSRPAFSGAEGGRAGASPCTARRTTRSRCHPSGAVARRK